MNFEKMQEYSIGVTLSVPVTDQDFSFYYLCYESFRCVQLNMAQIILPTRELLILFFDCCNCFGYGDFSV